MKKEKNIHIKFESLSDVHRAFGLPKPLHPLISLIDNSNKDVEANRPTGSHVLNFYKISYKTKLAGKIKYGQGYYDFDEGGLLFASPGQLVGSSDDSDTRECSVYTLAYPPGFFIVLPPCKKDKRVWLLFLFCQ